MKIAIVNGSPRRGNTVAAINAFVEGAKGNNDITMIDADQLKISGCKGCGACRCKNGCIAKDDTNPTIDQLVSADMILFTTPVYWWGMTAQLKLVIDKCYCRAYHLKNKKIGVIAVGGSPVESTQYRLIREQFECMANYLNWDMQFFKAYYAYEANDIAEDTSALNDLKLAGMNIT